MVTAVLFHSSADGFLPTELAGSPWQPGVLHGGAPAGLLAYCLERHISNPDLQPARLSIDLLRPVPRSPLKVTVRPLREGKRIVLLEASVFACDNLVALATGLFVKAQPVTLPEHAPRYRAKLDGPDGIETVSFREVLFGNSDSMPPGLHTTVQLRPVSRLQESGRGSAWISLPVPIIEGQPNSPFMLAALVSDFGNGVGQLSLGNNVGTINADVMLQLSRLPEGEWIGLESEALLDESGVGQVVTVLHDHIGRIGQVSQSIMPMASFVGTN